MVKKTYSKNSYSLLFELTFIIFIIFINCNKNINLTYMVQKLNSYLFYFVFTLHLLPQKEKKKEVQLTFEIKYI